jgi:soluble lytic murein transglycosylase
MGLSRRTAIVVSTVLLAAAVALFFSNHIWQKVSPTIHKEKINKYAAKYKMDPLFLMSVVRVESSFNNAARSHRGAIGLMQIMPDTAREMAVKIGKDPAKLSASDWEDPDLNLHLGVKYLSQLRGDFPGDVMAQLAAYNAGPSNVRSWKKGPLLAMEDIEYTETRNFVQRVTKTYAWLKKVQKVKNAIHD